jgi:hypothetical protein
MDENPIRILGAYSRPDLEINLDRCTFTSAGTRVLVEVLGRNQGPTKLHCCDIDYIVLANGLRGNSRLKSLTARISGNLEKDNAQVIAIAGALRGNEGLVDLNLGCHLLGDETWGAICDSLKTHPTLEVLNLFSDVTTTPAIIQSRIQALLNMMKVNISIRTMLLNASYIQHELYRGSVIPYLETNRLRPRVRAIQKTRPITYRAKVLGRALLSACTDANRFWMLLSENADVAFPPTTATTMLVTNLPTPTTAAKTSATSVSAPTAVAASMMSALTSLPTAAVATTASDLSASTVAAATAAANVATTSAAQKRKAHP